MVPACRGLVEVNAFSVVATDPSAGLSFRAVSSGDGRLLEKEAGSVVAAFSPAGLAGGALEDGGTLDSAVNHVMATDDGIAEIKVDVFRLGGISKYRS